MGNKKIAIFIAILIVVGAFFWLGTNSYQTDVLNDNTNNNLSSAAPTPLTAAQFNENTSGVDSGNQEGQSDQVTVEVKPAAKVYSSAEEAMAAVKKAASEYDDIIIEQFRLPGEDCTWCETFYASLKSLISDSATKKEELPILAEVLALSGKVDNLKFVADLIKNKDDKELVEQIAQAFELAAGGDEVMKYLTEEMSSTNERLQEAAIAAITNQGTRQAAEVLFKEAIEKGDPDGHYSMGIGIGEFVPDVEALPYIQEQLLKRDKFSPLAARALLNGGLPGLRILFEALTNSTDNDGDKRILENAIEHVIIDQDTQDFVHQAITNTQNQLLIDFAREILARSQQEQEEQAE